MLLVKSIIYTSILKIQQSLGIRAEGLLVQTYGTHYLNHVHCLNILNQLIHCYSFKKSLKRGQDQNTNAAYANENETSS